MVGLREEFEGEEEGLVAMREDNQQWPGKPLLLQLLLKTSQVSFYKRTYVSVDYGSGNPLVFLDLWQDFARQADIGVWHRFTHDVPADALMFRVVIRMQITDRHRLELFLMEKFDCPVQRIGVKSLSYDIHFQCDGRAVAKGSMKTVCCRVDADHGLTSVEIPREYLDRLEEHGTT